VQEAAAIFASRAQEVFHHDMANTCFPLYGRRHPACRFNATGVAERQAAQLFHAA
jgi:hypothetical protein